MQYVPRTREEDLKYEMFCMRSVRQHKVAKAALARQGVTMRVPIGKRWVPRGVTPNLHTTGRRRGVLIRAIARFDAKQPVIAMCIAILTAFLYFHPASDSGRSEPATVRMHLAPPAN